MTIHNQLQNLFCIYALHCRRVTYKKYSEAYLKREPAPPLCTSN